MKEKIGKLLELLNEYAPDDFNWCVIDGKIYDKTMDYGYIPVNVEMGVYIISKQFGFIQRLVEQDKIDRDKCGFENRGLSGNWYDSGIAFVENYDNDTFKVSEFYSPYLQLLMLLSISDTPIEFLISLLKNV